MAEIISNQFTSTINKGSSEPPNLKGSKSLLQNKNTYNNWGGLLPKYNLLEGYYE